MQFTIVFESCDADFTSSNHSLQELATAGFATLRLLENRRRAVETKSRIRLAFAATRPEADPIRGSSGALLPFRP